MRIVLLLMVLMGNSGWLEKLYADNNKFTWFILKMSANPENLTALEISLNQDKLELFKYLLNITVGKEFIYDPDRLQMIITDQKASIVGRVIDKPNDQFFDAVMARFPADTNQPKEYQKKRQQFLEGKRSTD